jgi:rubrerythrin
MSDEKSDLPGPDDKLTVDADGLGTVPTAWLRERRSRAVEAQPQRRVRSDAASVPRVTLADEYRETASALPGYEHWTAEFCAPGWSAMGPVRYTEAEAQADMPRSASPVAAAPELEVESLQAKCKEYRETIARLEARATGSAPRITSLRSSAQPEADRSDLEAEVISLRADLDAQAATIADLREALEETHRQSPVWSRLEALAHQVEAARPGATSAAQPDEEQCSEPRGPGGRHVWVCNFCGELRPRATPCAPAVAELTEGQLDR